MVPSYEEYVELVKVGRREAWADTVLKGVRVFNPYTFELIETDVAIYKKWIAGLGEGFKGKRRLNFKGLFAVPGFVDAHAHPDLFFNPFTFSAYALKLGVTSILADIHDFATSVGLPLFLRFLLHDSKRLPIRFFLTAPVINPPNPEVEGEWLIPDELLGTISGCPSVFSVSEVVSWRNLFLGKEEFLKRLYYFIKSGRRIEGHTPGARGDKLQVLSLCGLTSCHESISFEDVLERLRLGWWVMVREGSIRKEFRRIIPELRDKPHLLSRVILTADGMFADDMVELGYMDYVVSRAVEEGLSPEWAVRAVTLNPCIYLGVSRFMGGIAPGKLADIVLTEDISRPRPVAVFKDGVRVEESEPLIPSCYRRPPFPVSVEEGIFPTRFGKVPVMFVENKTITRLREEELREESMEEKDCNYIVMVHKETGEVGRGFVKNFGFLRGGFAISVSHEPHHIVGIGGFKSDILLSLKRVIENGGGACVFSGGKELMFLDLSFGGTMSFLPVDKLGSELRKLKKLLGELGSRLDDPLWCTVFLSLTGLPEVRITPKGVFHVKQGRVVYNG